MVRPQSVVLDVVGSSDSCFDFPDVLMHDALYRGTSDSDSSLSTGAAEEDVKCSGDPIDVRIVVRCTREGELERDGDVE